MKHGNHIIGSVLNMYESVQMKERGNDVRNECEEGQRGGWWTKMDEDGSALPERARCFERAKKVNDARDQPWATPSRLIDPSV